MSKTYISKRQLEQYSKLRKKLKEKRNKSQANIPTKKFEEPAEGKVEESKIE